MARVSARATKSIAAPPDRVLEFLRDYREGRPKILPANYTAYRVEHSGNDGPIVAYHFAAGGRERDYRLHVEESPHGLRERDEFSTFVSTWTVEPEGDGSSVTVEASWQGAGGVAGVFERLFAPLGLRRIYGEMLDRLAESVPR